MDKKIVQCMDDSNWHGEYCIVDMTFSPSESDEVMAVLLSNRRVGHHVTCVSQIQEISIGDN